MTTYRSLTAVAAASLSLLFANTALAQFDQTINVEGKYVPEVIDRDRPGMPGVTTRFGLDRSELEYDLDGVVTPFAPYAVPQGATGWRDTRPDLSYRGWVELDAGSWLDARLNAGYRFVDTDIHKALVYIDHNSTSLWSGFETPAESTDRKRYRYDERIGLRYGVDVGKIGKFSAAADYRYAAYNAYSAPVQDVAQHLNQIHGDIAWCAKPKRKLEGRAQFSVDWTAFGKLPLTDLHGQRETDFNLTRTFAYRFDKAQTQKFGVDLGGRWLLYDNPSAKFLPRIDNYGLVTVAPFYALGKDNYKLYAGVRLDVAIDAGPASDRFKQIHVSPNVRMEYAHSAFSGTLSVTGGVTPYTLGELHAPLQSFRIPDAVYASYYSLPFIYDTTPLYTPLDLELALNFGRFEGFYAGVDFGYKVQKNVMSDIMLTRLPSLNGFKTGVRLGYEYGRFINIEASGYYSPQDGETGWIGSDGVDGLLAGCDRPEWVVGGVIKSNPWRELKLELGCQWRGERGVWTPTGEYDNGALGYTETKLADLTRLWLDAGYGITTRFDVRIGANLNLPGDKRDATESTHVATLLPGLQIPMLTLSAGLTYRF